MHDVHVGVALGSVVLCTAGEGLASADVCTLVQEGTLRALSTLCSDRESSRRQLVESRAISSIVKSLSDPHEEVSFAFGASEKSQAASHLVVCYARKL